LCAFFCDKDNTSRVAKQIITLKLIDILSAKSNNFSKFAFNVLVVVVLGYVSIVSCANEVAHLMKFLRFHRTPIEDW